MDTIVFPLVLANLCNRTTISLARKESSPEVGSSSITTEGSEISSTPIEALFLSPKLSILL